MPNIAQSLCLHEYWIEILTVISTSGPVHSYFICFVSLHHKKMALSRSERSQFWMTKQQSANNGPGSYDIAGDIGSRPVNSSTAPFGSSIVREIDGQPTMVTPGPNTYSDGVAMWHKNTKGAIIGTLAPRMPDTVGLTPGPGTYFTTKPPVLEPERNSFKAQRRKVKWVETFNPPSIPGHQTNTGYREEDGKWLANKSDADLYEKLERPFIEEGGTLKPKKPNQGKGRSFSRAVRATVCDPPKEIAEQPGPGMYETKDLVGSLVASASCEGPTSSFKSTASRKPWGPTLSVNPGPGSYDYRFSKTQQPDISLHEEYQAFGKCKKRTKSVHPTPRTDIDPGQYTPEISFATPLSSAHASDLPISTTTTVRRPPSVVPSMSKAIRFPHIKNNVPGPGAYVDVSTKAKVEMIYPFGGTTPRFHILPEEQLGPGIYEPAAPTVDPATVRKRDKRNAIFIRPSHGSKCRPVPAPAPERCALGLTDWSKNKSHCVTSSFSKEARFTYKQPHVTPSPGDYGSSIIIQPQHEASSFSKEPRFPKIKERSPDSGLYNISVPFLKTTFNITL